MAEPRRTSEERTQATDKEKRDMGERMAERRKRLDRERRGGYKQKDVAERIGVSRQAYVHYERGNNEISASLLPKLAEVLEVPITYFYGLLEEEDADMMARMERFRGLDHDEFEGLANMADFLRAKKHQAGMLQTGAASEELRGKIRGNRAS